MSWWGQLTAVHKALLAAAALVFAGFAVNASMRNYIELPGWVAEFEADESAYRAHIEEALEVQAVMDDRLEWLVAKEKRDACRQRKLAEGYNRESALDICVAEVPDPILDDQ